MKKRMVAWMLILAMLCGVATRFSEDTAAKTGHRIDIRMMPAYLCAMEGCFDLPICFVDAALFLMCWVLGEAPFCVKDTFTGALSTASYMADTNLDRLFDERDVLKGKIVFCLISPLSFSGGNLVPAVFRYSQKVTLLGRTSGGGSCTTLQMSSAWGTMFQISRPSRMSFFKNGSFYDIDQGVEPDIYLTSISSFYDREKLTAYINSLI